MKYWIYTFDDDTYGIVKAYTEHGGYESEITEDIIEIENIDNHWFADNPDVLELGCMG